MPSTDECVHGHIIPQVDGRITCRDCDAAWDTPKEYFDQVRARIRKAMEEGDA